MPKILLCGLLGSGKSTICNELTGKNAPVADTPESCTRDMTVYVGNGLEVVDVPGLGDPDISTKKWLAMATAISGKNFDAMVFVINGTNRVGNDLMLLGLAIKHMAEFPAGCMRIVFTHADSPKHKFDDQKSKDYMTRLGDKSKNDNFSESTPYFLYGPSFNNGPDLIKWMHGTCPQATCRVEQIQVKNLVSEGASIMRSFVKEAAEVSEEVKEMAEAMTESACFHRESTVLLRLATGELQRTAIGELSVGDSILSLNGKSLTDDTVVYIHDHANDANSKRTFCQVFTLTYQSSDLHGTIRLSKGHFLLGLAEDGGFAQKLVQDVRVGERVLVLHGTDTVECDVVTVECGVESAADMMLFITAGKTAFVDNVFASCLTAGWDSPAGRAVLPLFGASLLPGTFKQSHFGKMAVSNSQWALRFLTSFV